MEGEMPFIDSTRMSVKRKADFTCCWCQDRKNKVEVHHIVPEADNGSGEEDNAAPLCGNCHALLGNNPDLRKEIKGRRDLWYETCWKRLNPSFGWPIGLDVPLLDFSREIPSTTGAPTKGIQLTDREPGNSENPPLLYLSVHFKTSRYFGRYIPDEREKWLYLEANMRFAFNLRIQVCARNERDVQEILSVLQTGEGGYDLHGPLPQSNKDHAGDYLLVWRENGEIRLMISTFTSTQAGISIHARLSDRAAKALANYLVEAGYSTDVSIAGANPV
jgi:hypothetical protein